jgi:putative virulence related protein PagC
MMKKLCLALATCATLGMNFNAMADNHTVSLGYQQTHIKDFGKINGVNVKYRFEWDSPVSIITSFSYMGATESATEYLGQIGNLGTFDHVTEEKFNYYSLSMGPAFRFNDYISFYGLVGINHNKAHYKERIVAKSPGVTADYNSEKSRGTSFMYGAGVQVNPMENIVIDLGYEGSHSGMKDNNHAINSFNVGLGYRF